MPETKKIFGKGGTRFSNAFTVSPRCCPSRASIMTGRYPHNHEVRTNDDADLLDESKTLQRFLQDRGYETAISGKFFNQWDLSRDPRFFDRWAIFNKGYRNVLVNDAGNVGRISRYSTSFVFERAESYIDAFERSDGRPWFLYVAPYAAHSPWQAASSDRGASVPPWRAARRVFEPDRSDKPRFVRSESKGEERGRSVRRKQLRTLFSVDREIGDLFGTLDRLGEEEDTLAFFVSDNGHLWGQHRLTGKGYAYLPSVRVPMMLRWPGHVPAGSSDTRLVATIDIAPTIAAALGLDDLVASMDGESLAERNSRESLLLEHWHRRGGQNVPTWSALVSKRAQLIEYFDGKGRSSGIEYYDLARDPHQLRAVRDPAAAPVGRLVRKLERVRRCRGRSCP
jgi:arylsulfatase A-like enzyme